MDKITINIAGRETINLLCTRCGNSCQVSVATLSNQDNKYRIKCRCGYSYKIVLDRRKVIRQKTDLRGTYITGNLAKDEIVDIVDLSSTGLCFVRRDKRILKQGQVINLSFVLENVERNEIKCQATVRQVKDEKVGVEFLDLPPGMRRILGFYLFNYADKDERVQEINFPTLPTT